MPKGISVDAKEFVALWKGEKEALLELFKDSSQETLVSSLIEKMNLSDVQEKEFWAVADAMLNDAFYTLLLGLDGCAQIGGKQETYKIYDESGSLISECGDIQAEAGEIF
jgi:hypothetical protein